MIYLVLDTEILAFPDAYAAKPSGNGHAVHVIGEGDTIVGNFPMRIVRYWGLTLPPLYETRYKEQIRWAAMTPEERQAEIALKRGERR